MKNVIEKNASNLDDNWPSLINFDDDVLPNLPVEVLPSWAANYAQELTYSLEIPQELAITDILICCATATARSFRVQIHDTHIEPTNLWIMCPLESGARKSATLKAAKKPLIDWQKEQEKLITPEIEKAKADYAFQSAVIKKLTTKAGDATPENREKLKAEIDQLTKELPIIPTVPRLYTDDVTPEKLGALLQDNNECLAWLSSEGNLFDILGGQYSAGNANIDIFLKGHAGEDVNVDRGSREPVRLYEPKLTVGLSPQPDLLIGLIGKNKKILHSGLLFRFLYFMPVSNLGTRSREFRPISIDSITNYQAGLSALMEQSLAINEFGEPSLHVLNITNDAQQELHKFSLVTEKLMMPDQIMSQFKGWASKAADAAARVSAVLHCIKYAGQQPEAKAIELETMKSAITLVSVSVKHTLTAFRIMGGDEQINAATSLWQWIRRGKRNNFTVRDAQQSLKQRVMFNRVDKIIEALEVLQERGYLKIILSEGTKASPLVCIRPDLSKDW